MSRAWSIGRTDRFKVTAEIKKNRFLANVGPDTYESHLNNKKTSPKWGMGAKLKNIDKRFSPSPDNYQLQNHLSITQSGSKWGFGTEKRSDLARKTVSPGPGTYTHRSVCFESEKPRFHVGVKLAPLKPAVNPPGAGAYEPSFSFSTRNLPSYSMKMKLGSSLTSSNGFVPGPGTYKNSLFTKQAAPQYGFGSSTRETGMKTKLAVPGPGAYKLKSSIGDVPEYAMPNRDPNSKYV